MTQEIRHTQRPGSADTVLLPGEIAYSDSNTIKVGDGTRTFSSLPDFSSNSSSGDNQTIQSNSANKIEAHGLINKNPNATYVPGGTDHKHIFDWIGTLDEFTAQDIENQHPDWLCFVTNDVQGTMSGQYTRDEIDAFLADKADGVGSAVMTSGEQTIQGDKYFLNGGIHAKSSTLDIDQIPADVLRPSIIKSFDKNGKKIGSIYSSQDTNGGIWISMQASVEVNGSHVNAPMVASFISQDGQTKKVLVGQKPTSTYANDTQIATTSYIIDVLKAIYPVGAIFLGTTSTCPMSAFFGTWELVAADRSLQGSSTNHAANTTIAAGLPDIYGNVGINDGQPDNVLFKSNGYQGTWPYGSSATNRPKIQFKASDYNSVYGNSTTVQPPAYVVNVWRRTA